MGVDIGCGMIAARTTYTASDIEDLDLSLLRAAIERAIPLSPGNYNHDLDRFPFTAARIDALQNLASPGDDEQGPTQRNVDLTHSPKWREQLGSLGGGNHFIELCLDEADRVWLFLHSGSRGVGNKIAQKHIKVAQRLCRQWWINLPNPDLAYLPHGTPEFAAYLRDLNWAQRFVTENRAEMMDRFAREFAAWVGCPDDDMDTVVESTVNCHHNYTVQETHAGKSVWLTRKGAVDANEGIQWVRAVSRLGIGFLNEPGVVLGYKIA